MINYLFFALLFSTLKIFCMEQSNLLVLSEKETQALLYKRPRPTMLPHPEGFFLHDYLQEKTRVKRIKTAKPNASYGQIDNSSQDKKGYKRQITYSDILLALQPGQVEPFPVEDLEKTIDIGLNPKVGFDVNFYSGMTNREIINSRTPGEGNTILHEAAKFGNKEIAHRILCNFPQLKNAKNNNGLTALQLYCSHLDNKIKTGTINPKVSRITNTAKEILRTAIEDSNQLTIIKIPMPFTNNSL